jgi:hypothetical protein
VAAVQTPQGIFGKNGTTTDPLHVDRCNDLRIGGLLLITAGAHEQSLHLPGRHTILQLVGKL